MTEFTKCFRQNLFQPVVLKKSDHTVLPYLDIATSSRHSFCFTSQYRIPSLSMFTLNASCCEKPPSKNHAQILHQIKIIVEFRLGKRLTPVMIKKKIHQYRMQNKGHSPKPQPKPCPVYISRNSFFQQKCAQAIPFSKQALSRAKTTLILPEALPTIERHVQSPIFRPNVQLSSLRFQKVQFRSNATEPLWKFCTFCDVPTSWTLSRHSPYHFIPNI